MKAETLIKNNIKYLQESIKKLEIELAIVQGKPYLCDKFWNYRIQEPMIDNWYTVPDKDIIPQRFRGLKVQSKNIMWSN